MQSFADSKSRAQELSNDISFAIFGHQTWDYRSLRSIITEFKHKVDGQNHQFGLVRFENLFFLILKSKLKSKIPIHCVDINAKSESKNMNRKTIILIYS